jgi:hypothetical protein
MIGDDAGNMPGVSCPSPGQIGAIRAGVAWTWSVLAPGLLLLRRLANLRGRVEEGMTEALEGGRAKGRLCRDWAFSAARTSL